jgi:class 3 adenylate cyclase
VAIQPTFLLIADIAGYTRFMKFHRASLAHAQDIVAQLLEAVIDATHRKLTLAKLEGDAAFFYVPFPGGKEPDLEFVAEQAAAIYRAFHRRASDLRINTLCICDGCTQVGSLKIKLVGHLGEAAVQKVKRLTELAGVDVILVHRMLKNDVPVPEYMLMTEPVHDRIDETMKTRSASHALELDGLGRTEAYYVDLERYVGEVPASPKLGMLARIGRHLKLTGRSMPGLLGLRKACVGFRNIADAPAATAGSVTPNSVAVN